MAVKHIYLKWWPLNKKALAVTIYPYIFYNEKPLSRDDELHKEIREHEIVHVIQCIAAMSKHGKILGWLRFYASYLNESRKHGYRQNRYEKEAYKDD